MGNPGTGVRWSPRTQSIKAKNSHSNINANRSSSSNGFSAYAALKRYMTGGKKLVNISASEIPAANVSFSMPMKGNAIIGPQSPNDAGKLTVVLDLDECLVHSRLNTEQQPYRQDEERKSAAKPLDAFLFKLDDSDIVHCNKRPGLEKFLQSVSKDFELMVYTAAMESYAAPLLDHIDPQGIIFRHRLYRDSCIYAGGMYIKDLSQFNRPLNRIVLVDNNAMCFLPQLTNGIPITSFYDDSNDTALFVLAEFLEGIKDKDDVRPFLHQRFGLENLLREHRMQIFL